MAEKEQFETSLSCSVCLEVFKEPVSLSCEHSFCRCCLLDYWDKNQTRNCPVCRRRCSKDLVVNFGLKEVCETFREKQQVSDKHKTEEEKKEPKKDEEMQQSESSEEEQESKPSEEEEQQQIESELEEQERQSDLYIQLQSDYEKMSQFCKKQAVACERQVKAEFLRLQNFLHEEEQKMITALREEQLIKNQNINQILQKIQDKLSSLDKTIKDLKKKLKTRTYNLDLSPRRLLTPEAGLLLNQDRYLGNLGYRVWQNMSKIVSYSPVLLDSNTANKQLCLSDDLRALRWRHQIQEVPKNPERFSFYPSVLGSRGFSSGVHQWDVEVGDHPQWTIGVANESVGRGYSLASMFARDIWSLVFCTGVYSDRAGAPVSVRAPLQKLRVKLDYDLGEVSFYNADDKTLLLTYTDSFTEEIFPFFTVLAAGDAKTRELRILPENE